MTCVTIPTNSEFQWLSQQSSKSTSSKNLDFARFTIQELIQQECCIGSSDYPVDRPSRLVQIECRKPGCRCVLKNEFALALKIIPGVTLVQGEWIPPNALIHDKERFSSTNSNSKPVYNFQGQSNLPSNGDSESSNHHVVLTSCCPSWFELVHRSLSGPKDSGPYFCPDVPVWSSGKAIWHAKPQFILLRKEMCCMFATKSQPFVTSSTDLLKKDDRSFLTLDADNPGQLRAGTVLRLLDCRLCRLTHKDGLDSLNSYRLISRHRSKPVSMLQFAVVGDKALAAVASSITTIQSQDALRWFADGPRLVYLPLDTKSILASPVTFPVNSNGISQSSNGESRSTSQGVHSLLSLLSSYQIPLVTRPIIGLRPNEWFFVGRFAGDQSNGFNKFEPVSSAQQPLLHLFACHHGDLIFLEPLSECAGPICYSATTTRTATNQVMNSRFFVVTPDMLAHHNFLVADEETCQAHSRELETHAFRVSHFLAACHPAQGLGYLLKHLEDTTHSSNTGPSHTPLTRTLGPISNQMSTAAFQAALASVAAVAALASGKHDSLPSDHLNEIQPNVLNSMIMGASSTDVSDMYQSASCLGPNMNQFTRSSISSSLLATEADEMNALCDEIEDIYFYVRNGHFPAQSRSMSSLPHQHGNLDSGRGVPQISAPISPKLMDSALSNRMNQKRRQQSTDHALDTSMQLADSRTPNFAASKVTSKAPVVIIRANPMDQTATRTKVSINSPMHNGNKLANVLVHSSPATPNSNANYDSGTRFLQTPQQIVTMSPRQLQNTQHARNHPNIDLTGYMQVPTDSYRPTVLSSLRNPTDSFSPSRIRTSPYITNLVTNSNGSATARERLVPTPCNSTPVSDKSPFLVIPAMVQSAGQFTVVPKSSGSRRPNPPTQTRLVSYPELRPDLRLQVPKLNKHPPAVMATSVNLMLNRQPDPPNHQGITIRACESGNYYTRGQDLDQTQNHYVRMPANCDPNGPSRRQLSLSTSHLCPLSLANSNQPSVPLTSSTNPSMNHTPELGRTGPIYHQSSMQPELTDELISKGLSSSQKLLYYAPDTVSQISSQYTNVQPPNLAKWGTPSNSNNNNINNNNPGHVPPSMPLLHQSRLCQSTMISSTPRSQQDLTEPQHMQTCPRSKPNSGFGSADYASEYEYQNGKTFPNTAVTASLKHANQSPNSSPDTGLGGDSACCDQAALVRPTSRPNPVWMADAPYCATSNHLVLTAVHSNAPYMNGNSQHQVYQF